MEQGKSREKLCRRDQPDNGSGGEHRGAAGRHGPPGNRLETPQGLPLCCLKPWGGGVGVGLFSTQALQVTPPSQGTPSPSSP